MRKFISSIFLGIIVSFLMCSPTEAVDTIESSLNTNSDALTWDETETVTESPRFVSPIGFNEQNQTVVTWIDNEGNSKIKFKDPQTAWTREQTLSDSTNVPTTPFMTVNSKGQAFTAWLEGQDIYFATGSFTDTLARQSSGLTVPLADNVISSLAYNDNNQAVIVFQHPGTNAMYLASYNNGTWSSATNATSKNVSVSVGPSQKFVGTFKNTATNAAMSMIADFSVSPNTWAFNTIGASVHDNVFHSVNSIGEVVTSWAMQTTKAVQIALFTIDAPTIIRHAPLTGVSPLDIVRTFINDNSDLITSWADSLGKPWVSTSNFVSNSWSLPVIFSELAGIVGSLNNAGTATFYLSDAFDIVRQTVQNLKAQTYSLNNGTKGPVQLVVSEPLQILEGSLQAFFTSKIPSTDFITMWLTKNPKLQTANGTSLGAGTKISGSRINNIFPTRKEYVNQTKWTAFSTNSNVISYKVYRNGALIHTVGVSDNKSGVYTYNDRAQKKRRFITYRVDEVLKNGSVNGSQCIQLP